MKENNAPNKNAEKIETKIIQLCGTENNSNKQTKYGVLEFNKKSIYNK